MVIGEHRVGNSNRIACRFIGSKVRFADGPLININHGAAGIIEGGNDDNVADPNRAAIAQLTKDLQLTSGAALLAENGQFLTVDNANIIPNQGQIIAADVARAGDGELEGAAQLNADARQQGDCLLCADKGAAGVVEGGNHLHIEDRVANIINHLSNHRIKTVCLIAAMAAQEERRRHWC